MREKKVPLKELFKNGDSLIFQPIDCDSPKTITEFKKVRKEQKKIIDSLKPKPRWDEDIIFYNPNN